MTFAEAIEVFRKGKAVTALKPSTRAGYDEVFRTRLPPAVQLLAGHANLATTQRYAHLVRSDLRATIGLFG